MPMKGVETTNGACASSLLEGDGGGAMWQKPSAHILDLPDGCLAYVFHLAGERETGSKGRNTPVCPHMRYASVCRHWARVARTCVTRLRFGFGPAHRHVLQPSIATALLQFPNLVSLEFDNCYIEDQAAFFSAIVGAFPSLHSLALDSVTPPVRSLALSHLFASLPSLRSLSLSHPLHPSYFLPVTLPDSLFLLTYLEDLRLANYRFETLPPSFSRLRSLTSLSLSGFRCLVDLPASALAPLRALVRLHVRDCESLVSLPAGLGPLLPALEDLVISMCSALVAAPTSLPAGLRSLHLDNCARVRALPPLPRALERLAIERCVALADLPPIAHLAALAEVSLQRCPLLDVHGEALLSLPLLHRLALEECARLPLGMFLPPQGGGYYRGALDSLVLGNFPGLQEIPEEIGELSTLHALELRECKWVVELPDSIGRLSRLRKLHVASCYRLQHVPQSLGQLQSLEELAFENCAALRSVPDSIGHLQALRTLSFASSRLLQRLPGSISRLVRLEVLDLTGCPLVSFYSEVQTRLTGAALWKVLDLDLPAIGG